MIELQSGVKRVIATLLFIQIQIAFNFSTKSISVANAFSSVSQQQQQLQTNTIPPPPISPATKLPNKTFNWRSHQIRYQVAEPDESIIKDVKGTVILVHGLFVNSDHWRHTLKGLSNAGYRVYAIDLLGSGYSSKPHPSDQASRELVCGEYRRFGNRAASSSSMDVLENIILGTASGGQRIAPKVDLRHPLDSPYNFYTWADQIADFTREIILPSSSSSSSSPPKISIVCNSIGTISALQTVLDCPDLYNGVFVVNPNFRELHSAEIPFSDFVMPLIQTVQGVLRSPTGQSLFDTLAKPNIVKQILMEPYAITQAVDDTLVDVLLTPLLSPGASKVVFDTLSYSAGPLPEQQLTSTLFPKETVPVWVVYGDKDPWTPSPRVERMAEFESVERVIRLNGVGHCPHDEAPELVNPIILDFLERVKSTSTS